MIMLELLRLGKQHQATQHDMKSIGQRLQDTEHRQQQIMSFLARTMRAPAFLNQFVKQNEQTKCLDAGFGAKKRRLGYHEDVGGNTDGRKGSRLAFEVDNTLTANEDENNRVKLLQYLNAEVDMSSDQLDNLIEEIRTANVSQLKQKQAPMIDSLPVAKLKVDDFISSPEAEGRVQHVMIHRESDLSLGKEISPFGAELENEMCNWEDLVGASTQVPGSETPHQMSRPCVGCGVQEREMASETDEWWTNRTPLSDETH